MQAHRKRIDSQHTTAQREKPKLIAMDGNTSTTIEPAGNTAASTYAILSLDGGGSKGFYTLGVVSELEGLLGNPLSSKFDLIYGTSTGARIASALSNSLRIRSRFCSNVLVTSPSAS